MLTNPQDSVNGAELAGAWGTREAFVAVVTTNLPMVFPLFRTWLKPLLGGSSARDTDKQYKTPEGFRSIGGRGGGGAADDSRSGGRRGTPHGGGPKTANPLTNVTFTESEERMVKDIRLQNVEAGAISTPLRGDQRGIVVMTEFDISEDRGSQLGQHPTRVHEPW